MNAQMKRHEKEEFAILLTKAFDGKLSAEEKSVFERYLDKYESCRTEWQEFRKLKEVTQTMKLKTPNPEVWDQYWVGVYNRLERGIAWMLLSLGCIIVFSYLGYHLVEALLQDTEIEAALRTGIFLVLAGLVALAVSIIREKLRIRKSDPYKEVQR